MTLFARGRGDPGNTPTRLAQFLRIERAKAPSRLFERLKRRAEQRGSPARVRAFVRLERRDAGGFGHGIGQAPD